MTIQLPSGADAGQIGAWVTSEPVRELVKAFGGGWPTGDLGRVLAELDAFSAGVWDFRAGRERHLARRTEFDPGVAEVVEWAVGALGMVEEAGPRHSEYTHVLVLGGLIRACVQRPAYAARLLGGGVRAGGVVALGSFRELLPVEVELGARLGLGEQVTEDGAMDAGLRLAFGLGEPVGRTENVRTYRQEGRTLRTVAAPSGEAGRRANTADTYRYWAEWVARPTPGDRLLLVTSTAYVPFQHCDAIRVLGLGYGCEVDTVGLAPTALPFTLANYLQEVRSALRSMRALHAAAVR